MKKAAFIVLALVLASAIAFQLTAGPGERKQLLTLATTTSTENSGLLAHIHPDFEEKTGIRVKVIVRGTGAALQLAREGNVDVVLVHSRDQEDKFLAEGHGIDRRDVMYNDFVLIGPQGDPAGVAGMTDAPAALAKIAERKAIFVSRGDRSGTHRKEVSLWRTSGVGLLVKERQIVKGGKTRKITTVAPIGRWYHSIGQSMGKTIRYATEKRAYTLTDRGTWLVYATAQPPATDLVVLCEGDGRLHNPYGAIAVNPNRHPGINHDAAKKYLAWITSPATRKLIGDYRRCGKVLFHPAAGASEVLAR